MVARPSLDDADRARIAAAVAAAEARTSVEIRLVLAHASSHYGEYELIHPALVALIGGGIGAAIWPALADRWLYLGEAGLFALAALALQWHALRVALVPGAIKRKAAWRQARLNYASALLTQPHGRGVLLLYCSAAERYVEILVDDVIAEALPQAAWTPIVARFKAAFAAAAWADAFAQAATECADMLAPGFPRRAGDANLMPDGLEEA